MAIRVTFRKRPTITERLSAFKAEALQHGDAAMAELVDRAMCGDQTVLEIVMAVLADTEDMARGVSKAKKALDGSPKGA